MRKILMHSLITDILNLPDKGFQQFLIDLHPQKDIKGALDNQTIFELLDQDILKKYFMNFIKRLIRIFLIFLSYVIIQRSQAID